RPIADGLESVLHITKAGRITNPSNQYGGSIYIDDSVLVSGGLTVGGAQIVAGVQSNSSVTPLALGGTTAVNGSKVKVLNDLIVENNDHGYTSTDLAKDADGWFVCPNGYYAIGVRVTSTNTVN